MLKPDHNPACSLQPPRVVGGTVAGHTEHPSIQLGSSPYLRLTQMAERLGSQAIIQMVVGSIPVRAQ